MSEFIMPVAVAGAGKSTLANKLASENNNLRVVSSDAIREELYGNAEEQCNPKRVFDEMEERTILLLNAGYDVFYDATNTERKFRVATLEKVANISGVKSIAYVFPLDVERAIRQNASRERHVPEHVIRSMAKKIKSEPPVKEEGFDEIKMVE